MVRTRFAPSPTGFLHIGGAYQALLDYAWAKKNKGQFILRIEDTDVKRYVSQAEEVIYQGLRWLGLEPDESPVKGGLYGPYRQSERLAVYKKYALQLVEKGLAYYCFCSTQRLEKVREERQKKGLPPMYDRYCRNLTKKEVEERIKKGEKYVIRMKIPDGEEIIVPDLIRGKVVFKSEVVDDQVLLKSDGYPTYHLAVVVDDYLMKITHVIRGEEWLSSAPKHILLYRYFGWRMPVFLHTPTIRDESRKKLSKRLGHTALGWYQEQGYLPEALLNFLALLGWSHPQQKEIFDLQEFIKYFDLKDLSPVGPIFDLKKLEWMNGVYIRKKTDNELVQLIKPFVLKKMNDSLIKKTIPLIKERINKLSDYWGLVDFLVEEPKIDINLLISKSREDKNLIKNQLLAVISCLEKIKNWQEKKIEEELRNLADKNKWHRGNFFMALRIVITGKPVTPPLCPSIAILGRKETIKRIKKLLSFL
ncbi:MAG: glutamate--tRNA ligase [Microgenomates group bacterium]